MMFSFFVRRSNRLIRSSTLAAAVVLATLAAGCATTQRDSARWSEFTRSVNFTHYDAFAIGEVELVVRERQTSGVMADFRAASAAAAAAGLEAQGFVASGETPDFKVRIVWTDLITDGHRSWLEGESAWRNPMSFESSPQAEMRRDTRIFAIVEVSDADTGNVFWRSPVSVTNSVRSLHSEPAAVVIRRIMDRFPPRVPTDPDLPDLN